MKVIPLLLAVLIVCIPEGLPAQSKLHSYQHEEGSNVLAFDETKKLFFSAGDDQIIIWDTRTRNKINIIKHNDKVGLTTISYDADESWLISGGYDGNVRIWDVPSGLLIKEFKAHDDQISFVRISNDGKILYSTGAEGLIKAWNKHTGELIEVVAEIDSPISGFDLSPNGDFFAVCGLSTGIKIFDIHAHQIVKSIDVPEGYLLEIQYSYDGKMLATGGQYGNVYLYDLLTGQERILDNNFGLIGGMDVNSQNHLAVCGEEGIVKIWDLNNFEIIHSIKAHEKQIWDVMYLPFKNSLLTSSYDGYVAEWSFILQPIYGDDVIAWEAINQDESKAAYIEFLSLYPDSPFKDLALLKISEYDKLQSLDNENIKEGTDYAIIFAIQDYELWPSLNNPIHEANTIANILKNMYGFDTEVIVNPSKEKVRSVLNELSKTKFGDEDQVLIYFTGHGQFKSYHFDQTKGEGYIIPVDGGLEDEYGDSWISFRDLTYSLNRLPCLHILLIVDACYSGALIPSRGRIGRPGEFSNRKKMVQGALPYRTRLAITSGGIEKVSDGQNRSPFADMFIKALMTKGGEDFILTFYELVASANISSAKPKHGALDGNEVDSDFFFIYKG